MIIAHGKGDPHWAEQAGPGDDGPGDPLQPDAARDRRARPGEPSHERDARPGRSTPRRRRPAPPLPLERRHWLAALAILFVFFAPYQTLVQTVLTDDAVRKGLDIDDYDMTWQQVGYGVGILYGLFTGLWLSARIGARYTIALGLLGFALGNLLCGAAVGLESFVLGRFVDGFGKMLVMALGRTTLYKQFDRLLLVAIGFYGIFAYATRNTTPLLMAELDVQLSWRWMYWFYVPIALLGDGAGLALLPSRPPARAHAPAHRLAGRHRSSRPGSWRSCSPSAGIASGAAGRRTPSP